MGKSAALLLSRARCYPGTEEKLATLNFASPLLPASVHTAGGVGQFPLPPLPVTPKYSLFSCVHCGTEWKKSFYGTQRKSQIWKCGLEEKAFFPLTINKSLRITIYVYKQSVRKALHLKVPGERGQIKLCSLTLLHFLCTPHQKITCETTCILLLLCVFRAIQKHNKNILHDETYTPDVKSTLTFTKRYNQWCNLCK